MNNNQLILILIDFFINQELLQNADDAGATELHLVYDQRQHELSKGFLENMNQLLVNPFFFFEFPNLN